MKREEIFERLNEVFQDVFDDKSITVNEKTTANDIEKWDSLEHINLILAVETEFGMKFRSVYKELHADRETGC
ncbi:MAG: acyl carrier protein [Oscillospiraceae bacterium]|nr:acyl carrier protein [Oscillospiraceae bacterium]